MKSMSGSVVELSPFWKTFQWPEFIGAEKYASMAPFHIQVIAVVADNFISWIFINEHISKTVLCSII